MKFLVTGGAGFLGSALANRLVNDSHEVRVIDDLSAGDPGRLDARVLFTRGDVNDRPKLWTLLQGINCVYHLAARVSVAESILYPREYNATNVGGTVSVMEAMRDVGVRRVVLASSGAVYGDNGTRALHEAMVPEPGSPYAVSKLAAEHYVNTIGRLWGIETVILRIFNAYGPGQPLPAAHPPVIPRFLRQALSRASVVAYGDGRQTRDYVYITDVVTALVSAAFASGVDRQIVNVGSGVQTSVRELIAAIGQILGRPVEAIYNTTEAGGVSHMQADLSQATALLGYTPRVALAEGLKRMIDTDPRFQPAV
jgi:UDP-glucose 4-epimerase